MINPKFYDLVENLIAMGKNESVELKISTNGTTMTNRALKALSKFKNLKVNLAL